MHHHAHHHDHNSLSKFHDHKEEENMDLTFYFHARVILAEGMNKLNYIGNYTYSNSANIMSKSIGQQIDNKMKRQQELEKQFEDLIIDKSRKVDLVDQESINDFNYKNPKVRRRSQNFY